MTVNPWQDRLACAKAKSHLSGADGFLSLPRSAALPTGNTAIALRCRLRRRGAREERRPATDPGTAALAGGSTHSQQGRRVAHGGGVQSSVVCKELHRRTGLIPSPKTATALDRKSKHQRKCGEHACHHRDAEKGDNGVVEPERHNSSDGRSNAQ
jgi:hypothetical protein